VCCHFGAVIDPDTRDMSNFNEDIDTLKEFMAKHMPYANSSAPAIMETCMYTVSVQSYVSIKA
jgi:hypothetical protein